ncbi:hypothetical protein GYB61_09430 [bacterium]|nr:hypothetical protein [bacterium]
MARLFRLTLPAFLLAAALPAHAAQVLDYIVAVVDEDVILASELDQATDAISAQIQASGNTPPPTDVLRDQVRERLIVQKLQTQRAQQRGIAISDEELNAALQNVAAQNNMDLREFARALRTQGMDYLQVRDQVREELTVNRLRGIEVESRVNVSDRELDDFLAMASRGDQSTEYRIAQILVAVPEGSTEQTATAARAEAEQIKQALDDGGDFAQLAISRSDGQKALEGGDLGWRSAAGLPTIFAGTVSDLDIGAHSDVLESGSGLHIVKLLDKRGGEVTAMVTETRARHILIQPNAIRDDEASREEIQNLYQRLQSGEDLADLAKEHSDDPGSANQGGDLGWRAPGSFVPAFETKLGEMEVGQVSQPFRSQFGWHIIEVLDRRERDNGAEVQRAQAREAIRRRKVAEEYESWLRQLREEAYVDLRAAPDAAALEPGSATES